MIGTGSARQLVVVSAGGGGYSWQQQCSLDTYTSIANVETAPYCEQVSPANASPWRSTVIETYTIVSASPTPDVGSGGGSSGAMDLTVTAAAAAIAVTTVLMTLAL
jgi:hypothetical protein